MLEDTTNVSHKALINTFTKTLTSVKVSPTYVLKPQNTIGTHKISMRTSSSSGNVWTAGTSQGIEEKDGDNTHLEYLLNFLGPIG